MESPAPGPDRGATLVRVPMRERLDAIPELSDEELDRELTLAVGARTEPRRHVFDVLLGELQRRRSAR